MGRPDRCAEGYIFSVFAEFWNEKAKRDKQLKRKVPIFLNDYYKRHIENSNIRQTIGPAKDALKQWRGELRDPGSASVPEVPPASGPLALILLPASPPNRTSSGTSTEILTTTTTTPAAGKKRRNATTTTAIPSVRRGCA